MTKQELDKNKGIVHDAIWDTSSMQYTSMKFSFFGKPPRLKHVRSVSLPISICEDKPKQNNMILTWSDLDNPDVLDGAIHDAVKRFDTTAWIGKGRGLTKSLSVIDDDRNHRFYNWKPIEK